MLKSNNYKPDAWHNSKNLEEKERNVMYCYLEFYHVMQ